MFKDTKFIWGFYLIAIGFTVLSGVVFGFANSHTAPMPFLIELFVIFFGLTWLLTDIIVLIIRRTGMWEKFFAHGVGLILNVILSVYLLSMSGFDWSSLTDYLA